MTYSQRQVVNRILFWLASFIIVMCGIYILYVAYIVENYPHVSKNPVSNETYLMGRSGLQSSFHTRCCVFRFCFCYRFLFSSTEDRALVETNPSAVDV